MNSNEKTGLVLKPFHKKNHFHIVFWFYDEEVTQGQYIGIQVIDLVDIDIDSALARAKKMTQKTNWVLYSVIEHQDHE